MKQIPEDFIDKVIDEISNDGDPSVLEKVTTSFQKEQPILLQYTIDMLSDLSDDAKELGLFTILSIWKCYQDLFDKKMETLTEDQVKAKHASSAKWLETLGELDEQTATDEMFDLENQTQPEIYKYILETVMVEDEEDEEFDKVKLDEFEETGLFITAKTVMDCLNFAVES